MAVELQFIGSGDAFGSGGRNTTCFLVTGESNTFLIDCGASSLPALKRNGVDLNQISTILISHFHGDHFGGLPFFILDAQLVQNRTQPLTIAGPNGIRARTKEIMEGLFRDSTSIAYSFEINFIELVDGEANEIGPLVVRSWPVVHAPGSNPHGLKVAFESKVIGYTGDSEWTDNLPLIADGTDVFICECYNFEGDLPNHLSYARLVESRHLLKTSRLIMTHMSDDMLDRDNLDIEKAEEGKTIKV